MLVIAGWITGNEALKTVMPGWVSMKVNTALCLILAGGALVGSLFPGRASRAGALVAAGGMIIVAAATLGEYLFAWNPGIDEILFRDDTLRVKTDVPGRMAPVTALLFLLSGLVIGAANLARQSRLRRPLIEAAGAALCLVSAFALVGYGADAVLRDPWWTYTGMAAHTALGFLFLGAGFLAWAARDGGMRWFMGASITAGFLGGIGLMLLAMNLAFHFTGELWRSAGWVAHRQEVLREIQVFSAEMTDLESSQRGYILTGDERLLEGRPRASAAVSLALRRIKELTEDNPRQQTRVEEISQLVPRRLSWERETIERRRSGGLQEAAALVATGTGMEAKTALTRLLAAMRDEEYALLADDEHRADAAATTAFLLLPLGFFLGSAILLGGLFFLNAGMGERLLAEHRLAASVKNLQDLSDALDAHAIVAVTDPRGKILRVNDRFCALSKYRREELIGRDHRIVNSGHHPKEFIRELWDTINAGRIWHGEICNRAKDGSLYWVDTTIVPFRDAGGNIRQHVAIRADISARKAAEMRLRRERDFSDAVLNSLPGVFYCYDEQHRFLRWNRNFERVTGYTAAEIARMAPADFIAVEDRPRLSREIAQVFATGESFLEASLLAKDGRATAYFFTGVTLELDGRVALAGVGIDITKRKDAERALRELNETLEHKVAARTVELEAVNRELETFCYSVSHDLRAPLRGIAGFGEILRENYGSLLDDTGRAYLTRVLDAADRMGQLIDDLLNLSRVTREEFRGGIVDLTALARVVLDALRLTAPDRAVEFHVADDLCARGDARLLRVLLENLLGNAWKFTARKTVARISFSSLLIDGSPAFFVRDNGAGFDPRYAGKLFAPFQRLHHRSDFPGSGIGLATAQRIVHRHGGRIWAEAAVDQGATIYFTIDTTGRHAE